jgi:hypothetical protein
LPRPGLEPATAGLSTFIIVRLLQVNVPSKHFNARFLPSALDERNFSVPEAAYALMMMRKLSMPFFALLKENGVEMKADWHNHCYPRAQVEPHSSDVSYVFKRTVP